MSVFYASRLWGLSYFASIPLAMALTAGIGVLNSVLVYRPLQRHGGATTFIAALGILLILQNLALWIFVGEFRLLRSPLGEGRVSLGGVILTHHPNGSWRVR